MDGQRLVYQFVDVPKDVMVDCPMDMKVTVVNDINPKMDTLSVLTSQQQLTGHQQPLVHGDQQQASTNQAQTNNRNNQTTTTTNGTATQLTNSNVTTSNQLVNHIQSSYYDRAPVGGSYHHQFTSAIHQ